MTSTPEPKKKRRIVPIPITSPTTNTKSITSALNAAINVGDLKEQAKKGRELGPGRKIYVTLAPYQTDRKQVNWKRLLDEQAMSEEGIAGVDAAEDTNDGLGEGPRTAAGGFSRAKRPLDAYLSAITRAMNMAIDSSDSDDGYDPVPMEDDGDGDDDGSDEENEKDGDVDAEVNLEENAEGTEKAERAGKTGKGLTGDKGKNKEENGDSAEKGGQTTKKKPVKRRGNSYDYHDDWIDDSEFIQMVEFTDNRKGKHRGFVIYRGKIERDEADNEAGYEYDEEAGTRQRRRGNAKASSKKRDVNGKGGRDTPAAKTAKAKKEAPPPYEMPEEVKEALERIDLVVKEVPEAALSSQKRKVLPKRVREELLRSEPVFKPEIDRLGIPAQKAIVDCLMKSVGSFTSRQNINAYVNGKMGGMQRQELVFSADIIRDIVKDLKPIADKPDEKPVFESDDAYLKHIPLVVLSKVAKQIRLGLQGETLKSDRATAVLDEVLGCFPGGTMQLTSLMRLVPEVEALEEKMEKDAMMAKMRTREAHRGIKAVEEMGVQVSDLDIDTAVEKAVAHGADGDKMRALLETDEAIEDENWSCALKLLAVAGPHGLKIKFIGLTGQSSGLLKKGKDLHIRTVASKITRLFNENVEDVGKIKDSNGYYALRLFPGNVFEEVEWKQTNTGRRRRQRSNASAQETEDADVDEDPDEDEGIEEEDQDVEDVQGVGDDSGTVNDGNDGDSVQPASNCPQTITEKDGVDHDEELLSG